MITDPSVCLVFRKVYTCPTKKGLTLESPPSESILFKWSNSKVIFLHRDICTSCICCRLKALGCCQWHFGKQDSYCNHKMLAWLLPVMHKSYYLICLFNNFLQVLLEDIMLLGGKNSAWFHFVVFQNPSPWSCHIGLNQNDYRDYFFFLTQSVYMSFDHSIALWLHLLLNIITYKWGMLWIHQVDFFSIFFPFWFISLQHVVKLLMILYRFELFFGYSSFSSDKYSKHTHADLATH